MQNLTIRLREELIDRLDREAEEAGVTRSEYIRQIIEDRHRAAELEETVDDLRDRLNAREERVRELEEQLARRSQVEEKVDELALEVREEATQPPFFVRWYRWFRKNE